VNRSDVPNALRRWIQSCPGAEAAAGWLIARAGGNGTLPARLRVDRVPEIDRALTALLSDRYLSGTIGGARYARIADYEARELGEAGALLEAMASATGKQVENRRAARQQLERRIIEFLSTSSEVPGLRGRFATRELKATAQHRGRVWRRAVAAGAGWSVRAVELYLRLLDHVQSLADEPGAVHRLADVSRTIAGDTHWLRPGTEAWRDLSDDLLEIGTDRGELASRSPEERAEALRDAGLVENLTSIAVLVYGSLRIRRRSTCWGWLEEAVAQRMPVWLSAAHLEGASFESSRPITRVIAVENETSFHDLVDATATDGGTAVVLTAGHANRAVIKCLRLLREACPHAHFVHQGDLDLPGVRILASLQRRCGFDIEPECMDADTHRRYRQCGIALDSRELDDLATAIRRADLPCRELLAEILTSRLRIEQENITHTHRRTTADVVRD